MYLGVVSIELKVRFWLLEVEIGHPREAAALLLSECQIVPCAPQGAQQERHCLQAAEGAPPHLLI